MMMNLPIPTPTVQPFPPNLLRQTLKFNSHFFLLRKPNSNSRTLRISCSKAKDNESPTGDTLAIELGREISKLNAHVIQREEALKRSRELLFAEICSFVGLKSGDMNNRWRRMNEEEKWVLSREFVAEWSAHFHPLSAKSVKEMVEEFSRQSHEEADGLNSGKFFSDFVTFMGFSRNNEQD